MSNHVRILQKPGRVGRVMLVFTHSQLYIIYIYPLNQVLDSNPNQVVFCVMFFQTNRFGPKHHKESYGRYQLCQVPSAPLGTA